MTTPLCMVRIVKCLTVLMVFLLTCSLVLRALMLLAASWRFVGVGDIIDCVALAMVPCCCSCKHDDMKGRNL